MGLAALAGVEHQLQRFNEAFSPFGNDADLGAYVVPVSLLFIGLSFIPTFLGLSRRCEGLRKIFLLNAVVPLASFMLGNVFLYLPDAATLENIAMPLAICGGVVLWISTMIDAATA